MVPFKKDLLLAAQGAGAVASYVLGAREIQRMREQMHPSAADGEEKPEVKEIMIRKKLFVQIEVVHPLNPVSLRRAFYQGKIRRRVKRSSFDLAS